MRLRQSLQGRGLRSIGLIVLSCGILCVHAVAQRPVDVASVQRSFVTPPDDARPMMRWWWFGPGVVKPELEREILAMKAGGIGGFEIQPVYPMALDDQTKNFRNLPYLSDEFLDAVKFASETANKNGMRVDMTLASGWPYGGPHVPIDQASEQLKAITVEVAPGADFVVAPAIGNGESLVAAFIADGAGKQFDSDKMTRLTEEVRNGRMALAPKPESRVVEFFVATGTGQQVKRAAVDADGFVLDHFSRTAVDNHLHTVADRLMTAFGDKPPYAVFSDSLEVYNADWTPDLLAEFQRRRGYDLAPYLPQLYSGTSAISGALRHDWGVTLTELVDERYLTPVNDWAIAHHTRFRSQTYGHPAVSLSSNNLVALPEGEGPQWKSFSFTRWATSASHLYGRPVTSAETWTWLHSPAFRATPLDMKAEADCFFLEGVNQLIGHGWPYTPPGVAEPGWSFYAAAVFNDHNPWWSVMPDVTKYLQRMSYLLRQGKPANDVAVLLPNDDAYANFKPGTVSLSDEMKKLISPALMQGILSAGYNVDYIDAEAIKQVGVPYPVLILPHVERLSPETLKTIAAYAEHGGKVIAVGSTPDLAPGFVHAEQVTAEVKSLSKALFSGSHAQVVSQEDELGAAIQQAVQPDMKLSSDADVVGFLHRKLEGADVYFVANTSNHAVNATATFRANRKFASSWNPFTGVTNGLQSGPVKMELAPYESRVIVFSDTALAAPEAASTDKGRMVADLSHGWEVRFPGSEKTQHSLDAPASWTDDPGTRFFSGEAVYTKNVTLSAADLAGAKRLVLDFGEGTPVSVDPKIKSGTRALLDGPIREAAVVSVNGKRVGSVWHPPYVLDLGGELHAGENRIEIRVSNTAINELAGRAPADYRLLWARYGQRFIPQDMDNLQPLPSGILGGVHLLEMK
jgi:hypothetical protein